ncbi:unnamed protein product, partial [Mycena citricolor]
PHSRLFSSLFSFQTTHPPVMRSLSTTVTLLSLSATALAGSSCIAFDTTWNLLAFGFNGKDFNAGTSTSWSSGSATDITATGRPPFNGNNTKCYLAEFFNAIYVLGADTSKPSDIYIYDASAKSWSTQAITGGPDMTNYEAILDHDTNVFYALSKGETFSLDMASLKAAQSSSIAWIDQGPAGITTTNYDPVMAIAQNHIYLFGVPNVPAGNAAIFVIHFAFWQPGSQSYNGNFPDTHGQATSFFLDSVVQENIAFIPDDGSATYIVNVQFNTTNTMAGPSTVDSKAVYFASETALVQLASSGAVSWIPYNPTDASANSAAKWSTVQNLAAVAPAGSGSSASSSASGGSASTPAAGSPASQTAGAASKGASASATGSASQPSGSSAASRSVIVSSGSVLGMIAVALSLF